MTSGSMDLRRYPRVHVEEGYSIRFQAGDRRFFGLPVTTLGGGGCCFRASLSLGEGFRQDMILTRVCIEHPGIPRCPQQARITWIQRDHRAEENPSVQVGLEYLDPTPEFIEAIDQCIASLLKKEALR